MPDPVAVPPDVAEQARKALAERARTAGIEGASRRAVMCAMELSQAPFVPAETLELVGAWHAANPHATTSDGRCTRLAGLYGGAAGKRWARDYEALPTTSWLSEESATLEAFPQAWPDDRLPVGAAAGDPPIAAGVAVLALDTGRVLMLQRALDDEDPASGTWEFPGGHIDPGETPHDAAMREFAEETGVQCPGIEALGPWTSPDGVYVLHCHAVTSEADVPLNVDHEDRQALNPDDPDGDCIEVYCWWAPEHAAENPALRDEAKWTPWDEIEALAEIASPVKLAAAVAHTAAFVTEDQARAAAMRAMSQKAQKARDRLEDRLMAAAQVAMRDAIRRAGVKVTQRASRRSKAAKDAVAAANHKWTPAVLAAVGMTEADLIRQAFDSLGERYEQWVLQAATDQLRAVAAVLGIPEADMLARMRLRTDDIARAASLRLNADLTQWAYRLLAEPTPSFGDVGEVPVDPTLPRSILQPSLALADGRTVDAPYGDGLLLEAWLTYDPNAPIEVVTWDCGDPARPFPPHHELCGTVTEWADYAGTFGADAATFPRGETYWFPGDHLGCVCDYSYDYRPGPGA